MSESVLFLQLPPVPHHLQQALLHNCRQIQYDQSKLNWMQQFHNCQCQVAAQEYGEPNAVIPSDIAAELVSYYQPFFKCKIVPLIAGTKNFSSGTSGTPPHCDRLRSVAVNYLLQAGGTNVVTSFYQQQRSNSDLSKSENIAYHQVDVQSQIVIPEHVWHAFDAQRVHSVENIKTERFLFSLFLVDNPDYDTFVQEHQLLIIGDIAQR